MNNTLPATIPQYQPPALPAPPPAEDPQTYGPKGPGNGGGYGIVPKDDECGGPDLLELPPPGVPDDWYGSKGPGNGGGYLLPAVVPGQVDLIL